MGNCLKPFNEQPPSVAYKPLTPLQFQAENGSMRVISFKVLKKAMKKFKQDWVVTGDNGTVQTYYKGYINESTFAPSRTGTGIAVSVMECLQYSSQARQDWKELVKSLGQTSHPNLVKFYGYCVEDNKTLLVSEYLHKGSLDRYIFGKEEALPWDIRVKIAIGTAQALAFLHSVRNYTVDREDSSLYREIRMCNILLDEEHNAKLFYVEYSVNPGFCNPFMGRFEYMPNEYVHQSYWGKEGDVYTFGVILLELLTGLKALDRKENMRKQCLQVTTKPFLADESKIREIIDPRLGNHYPINAVIQMGKLIKRGIRMDLKKRPSMQQVLDGLNDIAKIKD